MNSYTVYIPHVPIPKRSRTQLCFKDIKAETLEHALEAGKKKLEHLGYYFDHEEAGKKKLEHLGYYFDHEEAARKAFFAIQNGTKSEYPLEKDIWEFLPKDTSGNNYCGEFFYRWEDDIAIPALEKLGFVNIGYFTSLEADSFGPLSRSIIVQKDGIWYRLSYG